MRRSLDFWYHWISQSYVVGNVRYTVTIDVSYTMGIAHIEVMTWTPTYSYCSWMVSMHLFDSPFWQHCCPCSLCSWLLYRSFTTSCLLCCLLYSSHNEGTVVLTMWACTEMGWWQTSMFHSFIASCLSIKNVLKFLTRHVSILSGPKWQLSIFHTTYIYWYLNTAL
jgi:hypothetical protein